MKRTQKRRALGATRAPKLDDYRKTIPPGGLLSPALRQGRTIGPKRK